MITTSLKLRDYQEKLINDLALNYTKGHLRQLLYAPTGSGKTEIAAGIIERVWHGNIMPPDTRPYFIVERTTLVNQAVKRFEGLGMKVGVLQAENTRRTGDEDVVVASVLTMMARHKQHLPDDLGMGIIDEAHLCFKMHIRLMEELNQLMFIGLSATPLREGLGALYSAMVEGPTINTCISNGWLVPAKCYGPKQADLSEVSRTGTANGVDYNQKELGSAMRAITGDVVETWKEKGEGRKTICFAVDVAHADDLAEQFRLNNVAAEAIHYRMHPDDIAAAQAHFRSGEISVLVSVMKLSVGFDEPAASCAILARPTLSEALHLQQVGRVLRPFDGKDNAILLDHAGNLARFGRPEDFELPPLDDSALADRAAKKRNKNNDELVSCDECLALMPPLVFECPNCGHTRKRPVNIVIIDGELWDLDTPEGQKAKSDAEQAQSKERFYRDLLCIADERGYKKGWAAHQYKSRHKDWPPRITRPSETPLQSTRNWVKSQIIRNAKRRKAG